VTTTVQHDLSLTRDDITALRKATSFTLHTSAYGIGIKAYLRTGTDTFSRTEQVIYPDTHMTHERARMIRTTAGISGHGHRTEPSWWWNSDSPDTGRPTPACFYSAYDETIMQTIWATLRPGDTLHLSWTADNNNDLTRDAGLHVDHVHLVVNRGTLKDRRYLVGYQCSADNSARMIRRNG